MKNGRIGTSAVAALKTCATYFEPAAVGGSSRSNPKTVRLWRAAASSSRVPEPASSPSTRRHFTAAEGSAHGWLSTPLHRTHAQHGIARFVIAADPSYHALGLYESLGFERLELVAGVCRRPNSS